MYNRIAIYIILGIIALAAIIYFVPSLRIAILRGDPASNTKGSRYVHNPEYDKCVKTGGKSSALIVGDNPELKSINVCEMNGESIYSDIYKP